MKPGSVLVDLAVEQGGNVEGAKLGEVGRRPNGVKIVGIANLPGRIAADASALYARNLIAFAGLLLDKEGALRPRLRGRDPQGGPGHPGRRGRPPVPDKS